MNLIAHDIIIRPIITEKSSRLMELNKYTFTRAPTKFRGAKLSKRSSR